MANNSISPWSVITLADAADLAILVSTPSIDTQNKSYTVSTVGIQAECVSLNSLCKPDPEYEPMVSDCRNVGYPLPYITNRTSPDEVASEWSQIDDNIFGFVDEQLFPTSAWNLGNMSYVTRNPAKMAVQLRWDPHNLADTTNLHGTAYWSNLDDRAIDSSMQLKYALYAGCNVTFFNVTARLDGEENAWTLVDRTPSSNEFATTLWLPTMMQQVTEQLAGAMLAPARSQTKGPAMAAMNQHLARLMLGAASGYFEPAEATEVDHLVETLLGQYSIGPVILFVLLLCLYALLALLVFMSSWWTVDQAIVPPDGESADTEGTSMLALTQTWLISPIPLVGGVFPGEDTRDEQDGIRSAGERDGGVVYDGSISDVRLGVGLTRDGFGIWKRPVGQRVTEVDEP
ncbi:hypothetical protein FS837_008300 [Tulasnella sp. UAMH 9824]|nr:hypothetical protein FS837_008300 [Tulasnella sp. UAMH 9824]